MSQYDLLTRAELIQVIIRMQEENAKLRKGIEDLTAAIDDYEAAERRGFGGM
jgi:DNA anti-recombination protein RmuC